MRNSQIYLAASLAAFLTAGRASEFSCIALGILWALIALYGIYIEK